MLTGAKLKKLIDEDLNNTGHTAGYDPATMAATLRTLKKVLEYVKFDPNIEIADLLTNFLIQFEGGDEYTTRAALELAQFFGEKKGELAQRKRRKAVRKNK